MAASSRIGLVCASFSKTNRFLVRNLNGYRFTCSSLVIQCSTLQKNNSTVLRVSLKDRNGFNKYLRLFSTNETDAHEVSFAELQTLIKNNKIQLIDVREPHELLEDGQIPNNVNIPLGTLAGALKLPEDKFKTMYGVKKPAVSDSDIVFHCRSGKRSLQALGIAQEAGYNKARHYKGGWLEYSEKMGIPGQNKP